VLGIRFNDRSYRRMKLWEKLFLISMPFILFGFIFLSSYLIFFKATYTDAHVKFSLKRELGTLFFSTYTAFSSFVSGLESPELRGSEDVPEIRLFIDRNSLNKLLSNVPVSTRDYYRAYLKYPDGQYRRVKYRLRGANKWHWDIHKPSVRIKVPKNRLYEGRRYIELVNPEDKLMMRNLMEDCFVHKFGVMASNTSFVKFFVNNKYYGLYHMTLRPLDIFLIEHERMPGIIYKYRGKKADKLSCWKEAASWNLMHVKDQEGDNFRPMEKLIAAINLEITHESVQDLWQIMDKDKLARWQAAMNLFQGIHADSVHNHIYYFDPSRGLLEPIADDINGHGGLTPYSPFRFRKTLELGLVPEYRISLNERLTPILDLALRDPTFIHRRNLYLWEAINSFGSYEEQTKFIDDNVMQIDGAVHADSYRGYIRFTPAGIHRLPFPYLLFEDEIRVVKRWIRKREDFIKSELEKCNVEIFLSSEHDSGDNKEDGIKCLIRVWGNSAAGLQTKELRKSNIGIHVSSAHKSKDINIEKDTAILFYPGVKIIDPEPSFTHFFGLRYPEYALDAGSCDYVVTFNGLDQKALLAFLSNSFNNAVTGTSIIPETHIVNRDLPVVHNMEIVHPLDLDNKEPQTIHLGPGEVHIREDMYVGPGDTLIVAEGTDIMMSPGASIFCKGKAILSGKKDKPINLRRSDPDHGWGAFVLQGKDTSGSVLKYTNFTGGTLDSAFNIDYSGMVSIHWSSSIVIENCEFSENTISDDCLHIVHSNITIRNSSFYNTNADSIDLDYAEGTIQSCIFENSGNDLLDLMTSDVFVSNCSFTGASDKGISIGEKASPVISNCKFTDCKIAIESKDESTPIIYGCDFRENDTAYHAYLKKWEYGSAGHGYLINSKITVDNKTGIVLDNDSSLNIFESDCNADIVGEEGIVHVDRLNIQIAKTVERLGKFKEDEVGTQKPF